MEKLNQKLSDLFNYFNALPLSALVFLILALIYVTFVPRGNEEQYLALSKHFMDPQWIPNSTNLNEFAGTRLIFQVFIGLLLKVFSFEITVLLGRVVLCIGFAFVLAKLYHQLCFSKSMIGLHLIVLFISQQAFFAGSWIFMGLEAKSFAYLIVFLAFSAYLNGNHKKVLIFLIFASYFHLLVGGFVCMYFFICQVLFDKDNSLKSVIKSGLSYTLAMLPLLLYMRSALGSGLDSNPSSEWIYTYFRNAHHTVMYRNWDHFYNLHGLGVLKSVIAFLILVLTYNKIQKRQVEKISQFAIVTFLASFILIGIGAFDKTGVLLKFYLYRINTLSVFTAHLVFVFLLFKYIPSMYSAILKAVILIIVIFHFYPRVKDNFSRMSKYKSDLQTSIVKMTYEIKEKTEIDAVILYLTHDNNMDGHFDFIRRTERSRFVSHKFVPAEMDKLPEWYKKLKIREKLIKDISHLESVRSEYQIDYILAKRNYSEFELIAEQNDYKLFKIK